MLKTFQKHRKRWLAGITIMAMIGFAFPLTRFGASDNRRKHEVKVVATIYDKKVTNEDIDKVQRERQIANTFFQYMMSTQPQGWRYANLPIFGPVRDEDSIKDAIRLDHKADELGIRISDDMVKTWINRWTEGKLTNEQFDDILNKLSRLAPGITDGLLFNILRNQLKIEQVQPLVTRRFGPTLVTPYESWQFYQKLNDKLGLEVIPVSVAQFADQISDPGDATLRELYNKYIGQLPNPASPDPGFKQPRRVNVQYGSISLEAFALAAKPELEVSDEEIQQYYDSHKELYRVRPTLDTTPGPAHVPEKPSLDPTEPSAEKKDGDGPDKDTNKGDSDSKKQESPQPDDAKSQDNPCDQLSDDPAAPAQDAAQSPAEQPAKQDPKDDSKAAAPSGDAPADAKPGQDAAKQEGEKGSDEKTDEKTDEKKSDDKKQDSPRYRPLEEVTGEIRESVEKEKARALLVKRLGQIDLAVNDYGRVYLKAKDKFDQEKADNPSLEFVAPPPPDFAKTVEEAGLKFSETGLISLDDELSKVAGLGDAVELQGGRARGRTVSEVMRSSDLYEPRDFQSFREEFFSAWKIDDTPEREPSFDEIRDQVLQAFRMNKARELARDRADKLAASLRDLGGDVKKLQERENGLETITVPPTSLWSNAPVFSMNQMSRAARVATELPGLKFPSDEFRSKTFELKEGEVAVAPNQPQDIYYVVLLTRRELASREEFARSRQFIEMQIQTEQSEKMYSEWLADLRRESSGS